MIQTTDRHASSATESSTNGKGKDPVLWNDWHVVAKGVDLQPGTLMKFRLLDTDLVVWRGEDGQVHVWADRCPHRSVRLSNGKVEGNTLVCSYHGMVYNPEGQCIKVPAHPSYPPPKQACVRTFQVRERYNLVYVCLGEPEKDVVAFPEWDESTYRCYLTGPYFIQSNGYRAIENFLDVAHFPFIHGGILGDLDKPEIEDYEVVINEAGVFAKDIRVWQPDPYGTGVGDYVIYDYWAFRPLTAYLRKYSPNGDCLTLLYNVTPISEEECVAWMSGSLNYAHSISDEEVQAFQDKIVLQDLNNLESHFPKKLPLNAPLEFHVPSDRSTLMYRKWLKQLGITYGIL
ncbi:MAG: aromatic ring-hydroxylating dioxygenase subunit alpha [Leptolyngbyaceae cyanobacterium HOT.MB2.61]|nr:aromatic ring-hydroxylating dioxygenase subunit alpha [Leptolyngbyaceae cyanobacterium HOT.MB2.61]